MLCARIFFNKISCIIINHRIFLVVTSMYCLYLIDSRPYRLKFCYYEIRSYMCIKSLIHARHVHLLKATVFRVVWRFCFEIIIIYFVKVLFDQHGKREHANC